MSWTIDRLWTWFRRRSPIAEINSGTAVGIYLVPGVFRVLSITYNTDGEAIVYLTKEDKFLRRHKV